MEEQCLIEDADAAGQQLQQRQHEAVAATMAAAAAAAAAAADPMPTAWPVERGKRRRVLGRICKGIDAVRATKLWSRMPMHRREAMLSGGCEGAGSLWATVPTKAQLQLTCVQFTVATRKRCGMMRRPREARTCQLPTLAGDGDVCGAVLD